MRVSRFDNLDYDQLRGVDKAAILINYLGKDAIKVLFQKMDDGEIRKLLHLMSKFKIVPVSITKRVLEEYYEMLSESEDFIFSEQMASKDTIIDALGEERARGILDGLNISSGSGRTLESLEMVDAKSLSTFLVNEHPQTVAVILAHLEPEKKGEVLRRLPESLQAEVVLRMANLDNVDQELIAEIDKVLKNQLSNSHTVEQASLGGVQPVAEMLNVMDKNSEQSIMSRLEEKDPLLAEEIRKLMFVFEDIAKIDDRGIQILLKEVPNDKLLLALKTANDDIRNKIFKNISSRAAEMLREDLANMGPARLSDVESAQQEIVNAARRLEAEGKIIIARGGTEDAMV
ncbi:flagellar motor switch protein FliG [bacterium]|nr:flagellar motor switch protein FliG [bacterium]